MKLNDGTILKNVAAEDIQVTNASLAEGHSHPANRDEDEDDDDGKKELKESTLRKIVRETIRRKLKKNG